jgi:heterodisulfide reductase subunit B
MKIPYYPGCTLKTKAKNFERSSIAVAEMLGVELVELPKWNCCGVVHSLTSDDLIHHLAPIRNLVRVQEMNEEKLVEDEFRLVTLCSMCYNTLKRSNLRFIENYEEREKINSIMEREEDYKGNVKVVHFLEILRDIGYDKISDKIKKPLDKLKIAVYYGCNLLRPKEVGIDDPENPDILETLFESLGAEVTLFPYKKMCCGSYQTVLDKESVADLTYNILSNAKEHHAEIVVTSCPLCAFNLDNRQEIVRSKHSEFKAIPVVYFSQLMALAFGLNIEICGFDSNYISALPLLKKKGYLKNK